MKQSSSYLERGVSATKADVKNAVSRQDKGLYPGAFCKIIPDAAGDPRYCMAVHADGAGTKSSLAYIMARETGDNSWFSGIAQDSLVMNTDDLMCIGAAGGFLVSNTIGRNAHRVDAAALQAIIGGYDLMIETFRKNNIDIMMTGGETADVGDLVRTVICDSTVVVRLPRKNIVQAGNIKPGQVIVGLASSGRTKYEQAENSGIGSNGLTAARHLILKSVYRDKYPETYAETIPAAKVYCGAWRLEDKLPGTTMSVGAALLSPTRTYLPVMREILAGHKDKISGLIHCTGGGLVKCRDFGRGIRYVKESLFPRPPVFQAIAESGQIGEAEMYQVFNMGHRLEIYCDQDIAGRIITECGAHDLAAKIIGYTENNPDPGQNSVVIKDHNRTHAY